jgi:hypothetical protein
MCSSVSNSDPLSALNCDPDQPVILSFDFRLLDIYKMGHPFDAHKYPKKVTRTPVNRQ